jgi:hypothetical protein
VNDTLGMAHNGILSYAATSKHSDTYRYNKDVLSKLPVGWENNLATAELIESYLCLDKMALLNNKNEVTILNQSLGVEIDGIWYSNDYWNQDSSYWCSYFIDNDTDKTYNFVCHYCYNEYPLHKENIYKEGAVEVSLCDECYLTVVDKNKINNNNNNNNIKQIPYTY